MGCTVTKLWPWLVRINAVCPGPTLIPITNVRNSQNNGNYFPSVQQYQNRVNDLMSQGQMASPRDIAEAAVFLCHPVSRFINGVCLPVDAGASARESV